MFGYDFIIIFSFNINNISILFYFYY